MIELKVMNGLLLGARPNSPLFFFALFSLFSYIPCTKLPLGRLSFRVGSFRVGSG